MTNYYNPQQQQQQYFNPIPQQQQNERDLITPIYAATGGKPTFNDFITPIGKVVHCFHDTPQLETTEKTRQPVFDDNGIQKATYKITLAWPKALANTELLPFLKLAETTRDQAWGQHCTQSRWFILEPFLRDGDNPQHNTKAREYLFGMYYYNFKSKAVPQRLPNGQVIYSGKPGLIGPYNEDLLPSDLYAGASARVSGVMFATEYSGRRFISTRLNNIQKAADGERIGGTRPDARSQFDPLASMPADQTQYGQPMMPQQPQYGQPMMPQQPQYGQPGGFQNMKF